VAPHGAVPNKQGCKKMKKLLLTATTLTFVMQNAIADTTSATYAQIENEIGCSGTATDIKKDRIFKEKYRDRWVTWTGIVDNVRSNKVELKTIGSHSITSDFDVEMEPNVNLESFDKGQTIKVQFIIKDYMGCILPLRGSMGTVIP
jgi:hypothetical protein